MADLIANQRIVVGEVGAGRRVILPGERFDPSTVGLDEKAIGDMMKQTPPAVRVPEDQNAAQPAPGPAPTGGTPEPQPQPQPESETITRNEPEPSTEV